MELIQDFLALIKKKWFERIIHVVFCQDKPNIDELGDIISTMINSMNNI